MRNNCFFRLYVQSGPKNLAKTFSGIFRTDENQFFAFLAKEFYHH